MMSEDCASTAAFRGAGVDISVNLTPGVDSYQRWYGRLPT